MNVQDIYKDRDRAIYADYLISLAYRQKVQAVKYGVSESRYKAIINEQKKLNGRK